MSAQNHSSLTDLADFFSEYASTLMGSGVHTSRVVRNLKRLAEAFKVEVKVSAFPKTFILGISNKDEEVNKVVEIFALPINFEYNADLSKLSWESLDNSLTLDELKEKFNRIITKPKMNQWLLLLLVGIANAAFCRLFLGDWISMAVVFVATAIGLFIRLQMTKYSINHYIIFFCAAFSASFIAVAAVLLGSLTADVAISTSVLFLTPGVHLINGVIDILEGYILTGVSRLVDTGLLLISIAVGLSFTLWIVKSFLIL